MGTGAVDLHRARFAQFHELRGLLSKTLIPEGVLLGTRRDFLLLKRFMVVRPTTTRREIGNTLIVAPTRAGKGLLAVSQLLTWKHSVIVNDIKGELFQATAGYRSRLGNIYVIDPTGVGHCFDPLQGKETEDTVYNAAFSLLYDASEKEPFWTQKAARMLQQLFLAARKEGIPGLIYVRAMSRTGLTDVASRLDAINPDLANQFLDTSFAQADLSNKTLQACWSTLTAKLHPFLTETVVRSLTHSDFTAESIMKSDRPVTIYLRLKEHDLLTLSPLVRLIWSSLIYELLDTYDRQQGNNCQPVLLLIDEAGRTAIPMLADQATTVVGRGIYLWIAVQDLSQLETIYGAYRAKTLRNNCDSQIYYRPNDQETAEYLEKCLGKKSDYAHSQTLREGEETSQGLSEQGIPLMTAQDIRHMKDEEVIGFHRQCYPFMLRRMDWRHHPLLKQRYHLPAPELPTLPPITDIAEQPEESQRASTSSLEYINPDLVSPTGEKTLLDLSRQEQEAGNRN